MMQEIKMVRDQLDMLTEVLGDLYLELHEQKWEVITMEEYQTTTKQSAKE